MLISKLNNKKNAKGGGTGTRLLISVSVVGSSGPIRFVVNEYDVVASVIDTAVKSYNREGRLPVLGSNVDDFVLHCPIVGTESLKPWETIGSFGVRNFMLCKKPKPEKVSEDEKPAEVGIARKSSGSWKAWFNKSLNLKVSSH